MLLFLVGPVNVSSNLLRLVLMVFKGPLTSQFTLYVEVFNFYFVSYELHLFNSCLISKLTQGLLYTSFYVFVHFFIV